MWKATRSTARWPSSSRPRPRYRWPPSGARGGPPPATASFFPAGGRGEALNLVNARYGAEPGVKAYSHVSDRFSPFATQTIPATVHEAPYILDGLLMNETGQRPRFLRTPPPQTLAALSRPRSSRPPRHVCLQPHVNRSRQLEQRAAPPIKRDHSSHHHRQGLRVTLLQTPNSSRGRVQYRSQRPPASRPPHLTLHCNTTLCFHPNSVHRPTSTQVGHYRSYAHFFVIDYYSSSRWLRLNAHG